MKNNFLARPQTSTYRNESHIHFGDQIKDKQSGSQCVCTKPKKRPQSYRNLSKISSYMNDAPILVSQTQKVRYLNVIQNLDNEYDVPKFELSKKNEQSQQFGAFFQRNGQKMYKTIGQFTEYSDLVQRNSRILRRNQFNIPLKSQTTTDLSRNFESCKFSSLKGSRYYTGYRGTLTNFKMANTISSTLGESIREKKELKKQKQIFAIKKRKYMKTINKTCLGYVKQYKQLVDKERSSAEKAPLKNAMNRVLIMESIGEKMATLTQMYI